MSRVRTPLLRWMFVAAVCAGCASSRVAEKALDGPLPTPAPAPELPRASVPPVSHEAVVCSALVRNGGAEFDSEKPTTVDRLPKLLELVSEANRCWEAQLISDGNLGTLLQLARQRLVEWYELDARAASAILLGDSTMDFEQPRRGRQAWAASYLAIIERLAQVQGSPAGEPSRIGERMMRVDAMAVRVLDRLQQCDGGSPDDPCVQQVHASMEAFRELLVAEAKAWEAHPTSHHQPSEAEHTMPRVFPALNWTPQDRISRVAALVYWIATHWGRHDIGLHRSTLGVGFQSYLETFRRAEAATPLGERMKIAWPVYVHTPSIAERGTGKRVDEMLQDIVYDGLNLRAYFAMRSAQNLWLRALPPGPGDLGTETMSRQVAQERVRQAAHALVYAWESTTSPEVRLRNVAALLNRADLVFVQRVLSRDSPTPGDETHIFRSARLAELGLCLMNQSLLEGQHSPCPAEPSPTAVRMQPRQQAWCGDDRNVAQPFAQAAPPEALEAYRRVLGTLLVAAEPLTERSQCAVHAVLRRQPLVNLSADATLIQAAMDLVNAQRVTLAPERMGQFLATALPYLRRDAAAPCTRLGLSSSCSLPEIVTVMQRPENEELSEWTELWRGRFCTGVRTGESVIKAADALLAEGSGSYLGYLAPLSVHQLNDYRSDFTIAADACRAAFPNDEDDTPDRKKVKTATKTSKASGGGRGARAQAQKGTQKRPARSSGTSSLVP